jgi:hypothetical protein
MHLRLGKYAVAAAAFLSYVATGSAAVSGVLSVANCGSGGVIVTATTIDFTLPVAGGTGCIATGGNTNVTHSTGTLGPAVQGSIKDLVTGGPAIVIDFMTFTGHPDLHFDLTQFGPSVNNTTCVGLPIGSTCSVAPGTPFILQNTGTGTSITLSARGVARDSSNTLSTWLGAFTTQISGQSPADIQATILGGGSVESTYSGEFVVTITPGTGCPATIGFWKHHTFPQSFSNGAVIGGVSYTAADLLTILNSNSLGATSILGRQLVGAMLNIAAGAQSTATATLAITTADALLAANSVNLLTTDVAPSSALGQQMVTLAGILDSYNNAQGLNCVEGSGLSTEKTK